MRPFSNHLIASLLLVLAGQNAIAVPRVLGNGGQGVVCRGPSGRITSGIELYDFYEARVQGFAVAALAGQSVEYYTELLLSRLAAVDTRLAQSARALLDTFWREAKLIPENSDLIPKTRDALPRPLPPNCQREQIAIQGDFGPGMSDYFLRQVLWQKLSPLHKAGLMMHEVLYRHYLQKSPLVIDPNQTTSDHVRALLGILVANRPALLSPAERSQIRSQFGVAQAPTIEGMRLRATYTSATIPIVETVMYSQGRAWLRVDCLLSHVGRGRDLTAFAETEARIDGEFIQILRAARSVTRDGANFCNAMFGEGPVRVHILSPSIAILDDKEFEILPDSTDTSPIVNSCDQLLSVQSGSSGHGGPIAGAVGGAVD